MGEFVKFVLVMAVVGVVLYIVFWIFVVSVGLSFILLSIFSIYLIKSGRPVVNAEKLSGAIVGAAMWAAGATTICIFGSVSMAFLAHQFDLFNEIDYARILPNIMTTNFSRLYLSYETWLFGDAFIFFFKSMALIFLINRYVIYRRANDLSVWPWIPSALGFVVFYFADNFGEMAQLLWRGDFDGLIAIVLNFSYYVRLPFELGFDFIVNPTSLYNWAYLEFVDAELSLFRLAHLMPAIFFVVGLAGVARLSYGILGGSSGM